MELTVNVRMEEDETSYYLLYFNFIYYNIYKIYIEVSIKYLHKSKYEMFHCFTCFSHAGMPFLKVFTLS